MTRTLRLAKETMAELAADDLRRVGGALPDQSGITCPIRYCVTDAIYSISCFYSCGLC